MKLKSILLFSIFSVFFFKTHAQAYAWAKSMGGMGSYAVANSIAVDASGNVYTTGFFYGTVDFDPGTGTFNLTAAGDANSGTDIFVSKLDASGNFVWAKRMGSQYTDIGFGIAVDASGNVYTTGNFQGTVDFDPGVGTFNLTSTEGGFVSKLDAFGNFVWAKSMGGLNDVNGIAVDASGNVYTTGSFKGTVDFDPGPSTFNLTAAVGGYPNMFVSKLDASGNFVWAKSMGGTGYDVGTGIVVDASGNVYTTGYFVSNTADFDPSAGISNLTLAGSQDMFISKLSNVVLSTELLDFTGKDTEGGNLLTWATANETHNNGFQVERLNGNNWQSIGFVSANNKASSYHFTDNTPLAMSYYRLRQIDNDGKEELSKVISISAKVPHPLKIYPNVVKDFLTVETDNTDDFVIVNLLGQQVLRGKTAQRIDVAALPQGAYLLRVGSEVAKFVKE